MRLVLSLAAACAVLLSAGHSADAAIMVVNDAGLAVISGGGASTQSASFDATGATKLILAVTAEENGGGPLGTPTVTFGNDALTNVASATTVDSDTGQQFAGVFYLDSPAQGDLMLTVDWGAEEANGVGLTLLALSGAAAGGPTSVGAGVSGSLSVALSPDPSAGSIAIGTYVTNGSGAAFNAAGGNGDGIVRLLDNGGPGGADIGSANALGIYEENLLAGPVSYDFSGGSTSRPAAAAAAFAEANGNEPPLGIPEPATLGLLALGVCGAMFRRRV